MRYSQKVSFFLVSVVIVLAIFPRYSYAYLDPGTGSYIIQILLASFLGMLFSVKIFWVRIKEFFQKTFGRKTDE